jgi:uncharacterized OB-fold protein
MSEGPDRIFRSYLEQGEIRLQRSRETGRFFFYPRVAEPVTGSRDLEWVAISGRGTVYSTTTVRMQPKARDYNVVLIDLEEGPRMMSRVDGVAPDAVRIGMPVRAVIREIDGAPAIVFAPAG